MQEQGTALVQRPRASHPWRSSVDGSFAVLGVIAVSLVMLATACLSFQV